MVLQRLKRNCLSFLNESKRNLAVPKLEIKNAIDLPILLPYQINWLIREDKISVDEKSRQIGWSYVHAIRSVIRAVCDDRSTIYTCYNKDSAKQFIKDCIYAAKIINLFFKYYYDREIINHRDCNVFSLRFQNNQTIEAVAGNAENLRAKPGYDIIIDEAAFRSEPLEEILGAATATLIHGGTIRIGSTHLGIDSDFDKLCKAVKSGQLNYGYSRVTFREAVDQGLYKRICIKNSTNWSIESEKEWVDEIYKMYPYGRAIEELDVIPSDYSGENKVINKNDLIKTEYTHNQNTIYFRYYDLANSTKDDAFYSASVKVALDLNIQKIIIVDYYAERLSPTDGHSKIIQTINQDEIETQHVIELEPGSTSSWYVESIREQCPGRTIHEYRPTKNKLIRAIPVGCAIHAQEIMIANVSWADQFAGIISKFDGSKKPLINDLTDCLSGLYDFIKNNDRFASAYKSAFPSEYTLDSIWDFPNLWRN